MQTLNRFILMAIGAWMLAALPTTTAQPPRLPSLDQAIPAAMEAENLDGAIVMLVEGDEVVYAEAFGTDTDGNPLSLTQAYPIGRAADPFISMLVMMAAERGTLDPTAPLGGLLPGFALPSRPNATDNTNLARLMMHTGGLGNAPDDGDPLPTLQALDLTALDQITPLHFPFERFSYCRLCYNLLITALEAHYGQPIDDLLEQRIFYPLHMDDTRVQNGGILSTPADLSHFMSVHLQEGRWQDVQLMKPENIFALHRAYILTGTGPRHYGGYGWWVEIENGLNVTDPIEDDRIITALDLDGYRLHMTLIPAYRQGVLILTDQAAPYNHLAPLMNLALATFVTDYAPPTIVEPARPAQVVGDFRAEDGPWAGMLTLSHDDERGYRIQYAGTWAPARLVETGTWAFELDAGLWRFSLSEAGRPGQATLSRDGITTVFTRLR